MMAVRSTTSTSNSIDQTPKKGLYKGIRMLELGRMHRQTGEIFVDSTAMPRQMREVSRLLDFATLNNLVLTNTLGPHKPSRRVTWHSPDGKHHNQIDYTLVR